MGNREASDGVASREEGGELRGTTRPDCRVPRECCLFVLNKGLNEHLGHAEEKLVGKDLVCPLLGPPAPEPGASVMVSEQTGEQLIHAN